MKDLKLIENNDEIFAEHYLNQYYKTEMIPAEKKKYLTNLRSSIGPYMGIESEDGESHYLMDAASQIATLGLGFNPSQFFGTAHLIESWTNNSQSSEFKQFRKGFEAFLQRKLSWTNLFTTFCHSGAEANEIALGYCYRNRKNMNAKTILAFEGSFHGRMMMTLTSTWNKSKREPFEWPEFQTEYVKYPGIQTTDIHPELPTNWKELWSNSCLTRIDIPAKWQQDNQLNSEIQSLLSVHKLLLEKKIFSIIIEPMQCEGGDNYGTSRFYTALLLMARSFNIKVIFDEVQTGFHLGRNFFWHRQLKLTDSNNEILSPDYVVCAKKSQVGIVLSHQEEKVEEEFQVASAVRGYIHAVTLDQQKDQIHWLQKESFSRLQLLTEQFSSHIHSARSNGLAFAFDLNDSEKIPAFIKNRFDFGLLYYPAGKNTLRFRLNTSFTTEDLDFLFNNLKSLCEIIFNNKEITPPASVKRKKKNIDNVYHWHELLLNLKLNNQKGVKNNIE
ncbi:MAG: aminotransferase class III-fold pyridoxal phosphate-dependent enzyme, partial [Bdellovibrionales bacterium]|nr:aminotransferase class III-fold pyridoxal phosphate-dependent enzyme [Bdellovibrionales bacterium]